MSISAQQNFSTPFSTVRLYDYGTTGNAMYPVKEREEWSKEIKKYISSVEAVLNLTQDGGLGSFNVSLMPDLPTMLAWLNNTDGRGEWLRVGGFISVQFGYLEGNDTTLEFMGAMGWPEIDLNPSYPTITIKGIIANAIVWEGTPPINCYGLSGEQVILRKAQQFGYEVSLSDRFKGCLVSAFNESVTVGSEGIQTFVQNVVPRLLKPGSMREQETLISTFSGKLWSLDINTPKEKKPSFIFRFMGKYDLEASPQVIAIDGLRLPFSWVTFVPHAQTPDVSQNVIADPKGKGKRVAKKDNKGRELSPQSAVTRTLEAADANQNRLDEVKKRYLAYTAEIDTIGLPTLEVGQFVKFHNTGLIDDALWQVFKATHKWSAVGFRSSWALHCINFEDSFGRFITLKTG